MMNAPILSHVFPNGLALIAEPLAGVQSAAFTFLTPAGSAHDPAQRSGLSSFTCEMALRGAGPRDSRQFVFDLDNLGVEWNNSITSTHTSYSGATLAENLFPALAMFADVLRRAHLPEEELEAGRLGMLQELRGIEDDPAQKVMIELRRRHYPLPWGQPTQGETAAVEAVTIGNVRDHYRRRYHPQGTILGVAGRIDFDALVDQVGRLLGDWPAGTEDIISETAAANSYRHLPYESSQTQIGIAYSSVPYNHPDYFQAWGAVGVLSSGMSARLFTEVRERRGLCYSIYASYHSLRLRGGVFCYAGTGAERAQETLDVTHGELVRLGDGVTDEELGRLKARIKSALVMQQESSSARSASLAYDWHHLGRGRTLSEIEGLIDDLSSRSINAYLAEHPPRDFTIVTLGPKPLTVPS
jgi:predicted Zn-dependent peptidase